MTPEVTDKAARQAGDGGSDRPADVSVEAVRNASVKSRPTTTPLVRPYNALRSLENTRTQWVRRVQL